MLFCVTIGCDAMGLTGSVFCGMGRLSVPYGEWLEWLAAK